MASFLSVSVFKLCLVVIKMIVSHVWFKKLLKRLASLRTLYTVQDKYHAAKEVTLRSDFSTLQLRPKGKTEQPFHAYIA